MFRKILFLGIAIGISIVAVIIQQFLDKDYPYKTSILIGEKSYNLSLPVVNQGTIDCIIELEIPDTSIHGAVYFKLFNSQTKWKRNGLIRLNDKLVSILPYQKPNVKLMYYLELTDGKNTYPIAKEQPVVVRYENEVPKYIQYPGVVLYFLALIIICYLGMVTLFGIPDFKKYIRWAFILISIGTIFEAIRFFLAYHHLLLLPDPYNNFTFFKLIIIFLIWWAIYKLNSIKERRFLTLLAVIISLALYILPHQTIFQFLY